MKLEELLQEIQQHSSNGDRKALAAVLRKLIPNRHAFYKESVEQQLLDLYSESLYKVLLLELDSEEEESIEIAELSYLGISTLLQNKQLCTPEHYKRRILLLHYFSDYFTDAIVDVFLKKYRKDNMLQARSLAFECLEKMQLSDLFYLEGQHKNFLDQDEQLNDACNGIETDPDLSAEELEEAGLLHRVMNAYLKSKYKN